MKVLVVGGGGREHALAWKIAQSPLVKKVYCAPGNPGIAQHAECVPLRADDLIGILQFVREKAVDLTVVGPEDPLALGIVDELAPKGHKVFGPTRAAAELESSKVFAKRLMHRHGVPTAAFRVFEDAHDAYDYVAQVPPPIVVKADGLAKGKGALVCATTAEAREAIRRIMELRLFGRAGERIVVEECLRGEEVSLLAITDGRTILPLEAAQDHKRIRDGDEGPNTGGMGAYSPVPRVTPALRDETERRILVPIVHGMRREGRRYQGVLYAGLMLTSAGPQVLEFNVRWGDPETQPLLMRMKSDLVPLLLAASHGPEQRGAGEGAAEDGTYGALKDARVEWDPRPAVCVVMASAGYPDEYEKGKPVSGLDEAAKMKDVMVFHAGTTMSGGRVVTSGGRVLGVTALGRNIAEARERAYEAVERIHFEGAQFRRDIGNRAIG